MAERCHDYGIALTDLARWLVSSTSAHKIRPLV